MFFEHRLCIPSSITAQVVRQHHADCGHPGPDRLWRDLERRYAWGHPAQAKKFAHRIPGFCITWQACEKPHFPLRTALDPSPVPEHIFDSVALDIFKMPPAEYNGEQFDCFVLCVDRLSGWISAWADREEGLTGKRVAERMMERWDVLGIPRVVTSDRGPQFVSSFWHTLCDGLGMVRRYSQAYHHRANGRAERASPAIMERLRKLHADKSIN